MDITSRPVSSDDAPFLLAVYTSTREDELALVDWPVDMKRTFIRQQFDAQQHAYAARFPDGDHRIVMFDTTPVGQMRVARGDGEIRLVDIAILREHRGRGIGAVLLRRLQAEATERGVPLRHAVEIRNERALRFYERLGFRRVADTEMHVEMAWCSGE